jgi:hypothetical protein
MARRAPRRAGQSAPGSGASPPPAPSRREYARPARCGPRGSPRKREVEPEPRRCQGVHSRDLFDEIEQHRSALRGRGRRQLRAPAHTLLQRDLVRLAPAEDARHANPRGAEPLENARLARERERIRAPRLRAIDAQEELGARAIRARDVARNRGRRRESGARAHGLPAQLVTGSASRSSASSTMWRSPSTATPRCARRCCCPPRSARSGPLFFRCAASVREDLAVAREERA